MNIIEALKSGRPFKRKKDNCWMMTGPHNSVYDEYDPKVYAPCYEESIRLNNEDMIANDWELKPEKLKVTEKMLYEAFDTAYHSAANMDGTFENFMTYLREEIDKNG